MCSCTINFSITIIWIIISIFVGLLEELNKNDVFKLSRIVPYFVEVKVSYYPGWSYKKWTSSKLLKSWEWAEHFHTTLPCAPVFCLSSPSHGTCSSLSTSYLNASLEFWEVTIACLHPKYSLSANNLVWWIPNIYS